jgi:anti-anti-sigma regulatory factor
MNIIVEHVQGKVPVTIMHLQGELDASCYMDVIEKAKELYQAGARNLLLDLSEMPFMSSSGLVSLHNIAMLMRGEEPPDPEAGWGAMHSMADTVEDATGFEAHCKLLNPHPRVEKTLAITGFNNIFEILTDRAEAIAAFG